MFHLLKIKDIQKITENATMIELDVPKKIKEKFQYIPGQYLTFEINYKKNKIRRSYSICSGIGEGTLKVAVKHQEFGVFGQFVQKLKVGDEINTMIPQGRFVIDMEKKRKEEKKYLFVAAGSGITPVVSMIHSILHENQNSKVTLLYGNQRTKEIMFLNEIENLKNKFLKRFTILHFLTQENSDIELLNGRIDTKKIGKLEKDKIIDVKQSDAIYICGPIALVETLTPWFIKQGVKAENIKKEIFVTQETKQQKINNKKNKSKIKNRAKIKVILDGRIREFDQMPNEMIMEAAKRHNIELPYSCTSGMCATCRCKLKNGKAKMIQNFSLEEWEIKKGFILACQTQPISKEITLDFDSQ